MDEATRKSLAAVQHYIAMRKAKPVKSLGDCIHVIHAGAGSEFEAELTFSDLERVAILAAQIKE